MGWDNNLLESTIELKNSIDSCMGDLVSSRLSHDRQLENQCLSVAESLLVLTSQQLDCIISEINELSSEINQKEISIEALKSKLLIERKQFNELLSKYLDVTKKLHKLHHGE